MRQDELAQAACAGAPMLFHEPDDYDEPGDQQAWRQRRAKQICQECPVREACLAEELDQPTTHQHGVRGGMNAAERIRLIRSARKAG